MPKRILIVLLCLVVLLTACQGSPAAQETPGAAAVIPPTTAAPVDAASSTQAPAPENSGGAQTPANCTVTSSQDASLDPTLQAIFPAVSEQDWVKGPADAFVTLMEYSDFECPYCAVLAPVLAQLVDVFEGDVRVVFRHFPLVSIHTKATPAAQAAEAAGMQGKFWEMHDLLFANQAEWSAETVTLEQFDAWLVEQAGELGLDIDQFNQDRASEPVVTKINDAWEHGSSVGLPGTPFLLFNGQPYQGPTDYASLAAIIQSMLLEKRQFDACPPMAIDPSKTYVAVLDTVRGEIQIELLAEQAPLAVNSFIFLAREGWFDGITFHRVLPGFVAQTGDPSGSGYGGPGYAFDNEVSDDLKFDGPGVVGMANAGPGSNGSQFFITMAAQPSLDGGYTIFGRVISGMEVVEALTPRDPSQNTTLPPGDQLNSVTILEK